MRHVLRSVLATLVVAGCSAPARPPVRLAVLPVETMGAPAADGPRLREAVSAAAASLVAGGVVRNAEVDAVAAATQPTCAREPACSRLVARELRVPLVLSLSVATFTRIHLLRARLIASDDLVAEREISDTVVGEIPALMATVRALPSRFFPSRLRWYQRFWVWAGAAAVVAGTTSATLLLTRGDGSRHGNVIVHIP
jgi:hypothetical protein